MHVLTDDKRLYSGRKENGKRQHRQQWIEQLRNASEYRELTGRPTAYWSDQLYVLTFYIFDVCIEV